MSKQIKVSAKTLAALLARVNSAARIVHGRYHRKSKSYPWTDAIYKKSDPYEFGLYAELRTSLRRKGSSEPK